MYNSSIALAKLLNELFVDSLFAKNISIPITRVINITFGKCDLKTLIIGCLPTAGAHALCVVDFKYVHICKCRIEDPELRVDL